MKFHERLKELREAGGMTQEVLATKAGIAVGSLRHLEQAKRLPTFPMLQLLSLALNADLGSWGNLEVDLKDSMNAAKTPKQKKPKS